MNVKDTEGNNVPAKGEDGENVGSNVSWVTVDGVEYIKIGDKLTDLKQNNEFPNIAIDEETKTVIVTIDGQNYTLLQEGSAFKGLQTVVYRRQASRYHFPKWPNRPCKQMQVPRCVSYMYQQTRIWHYQKKSPPDIP